MIKTLAITHRTLVSRLFAVGLALSFLVIVLVSVWQVAESAILPDSASVARTSNLLPPKLPTLLTLPYATVGNTRLLVNAADGVPTGTTVADSTLLGGSIEIAPSGAFTYAPPVGVNGSIDVYSYIYTDGMGITDTVSVSVTISQRVWYVDNSQLVNGDGRSHSPFNNLADALVAADSSGDYLFLFAGGGSYAMGATSLLNGQAIIGQDYSPQTFAAATGLPTNPAAEYPVSGVRPIIQQSGSLTLATNHRFVGFDLQNSSASTAIVGANFGTLDVANVGISSVGHALNLVTGTLSADFDTVSSSSPSGSAIAIENTTGSVSVDGGTIQGGQNSILLVDTEMVTLRELSVANATRHAISMTNVSMLTLDTITLTNSSNHAISGRNISGLTITGSSVISQAGANTMAFNELTGDVSLSGLIAVDSGNRFLEINNNSGTLNLTLSNVQFDNNVTGDGLRLRTTAAAQANVVIEDSLFRFIENDPLDIRTANTSSSNVTINRVNFLSTNDDAVILEAADSSDLDITIRDSVMARTSQQVIEALSNGTSLGNSSHLTLTLQGVTMTQGVTDGLLLDTQDTGRMSVYLQDVSIKGATQNGIDLNARGITSTQRGGIDLTVLDSEFSAMVGDNRQAIDATTIAYGEYSILVENTRFETITGTTGTQVLWLTPSFSGLGQTVLRNNVFTDTQEPISMTVSQSAVSNLSIDSNQFNVSGRDAIRFWVGGGGLFNFAITENTFAGTQSSGSSIIDLETSAGTFGSSAIQGVIFDNQASGYQGSAFEARGFGLINGDILFDGNQFSTTPADAVATTVIATNDSNTNYCLDYQGNTVAAGGGGAASLSLERSAGVLGIEQWDGTPGDLANQVNAVNTLTGGVAEVGSGFSAANCDPPNVADLQITKAASAPTAVPGESITYTLVVSNTGPTAMVNATVQDAFSATGFASASWVCEANGLASCGSPSGSSPLSETVFIDVGGILTYTVVASIDSSATGVLTNTAAVGVPSGVFAFDTDESNNEASETVVLTPQTTIGVSKTDGLAFVAPGGALAYTIVVSNSGPSDAPDTTISDLLPTFLLGATWSCTPSGGATCAPSGSGDVNELVSLPSGSSVTYVIPATVSAVGTGTLTNTVYVTPSINVSDGGGPNEATDITLIASVADVGIQKDVQPTTAAAGESVTYTLVITNSGPSNAGTVVIYDDLSAFAAVTWNCTASGGAACNNASGIGTISETVNVPTTGIITMTVVAQIAASETAGSIANTGSVTVTSPISDLNSLNNNSTATVTILRNSDLSVTKSRSPVIATAGENITYTIIARNLGPSDVIAATISDTIASAILDPVSWGCVASAGATCAPGSRDLFDTVNMSTGSTITYVVTAQIAPTATGTLQNRVTIAPPGGTTDPDNGNNSATDSVVLTRSADASIDKSGPVSILVGETFSYTLIATNNGPSQVNGLVLSDTLPTELIYMSDNCGGTNTPPWSSPSFSLASGANYSCTIQVQANSSASGTITNTGAVTGGDASDPNLANNRATEIIPVQRATVSIADASTLEINGMLGLTVSLSSPLDADVLGTFATSNGTATTPADYTATAGMYTITAGTVATVIDVPIVDDSLDEPDETLVVTLLSADLADISDATAIGTILDDDAVPDIAVTSVLTVSEGVGSAVVTVSLSAISGRDVGVDYATSDVTAVAGSDYTAVSGVITVTAGSMTTTISVPIVDDGLDEVTESLQLTIANPQNGSITTGTSQINITDNDLPPTLTIADNAVVESAGSMAFTVTLSAASGQDVQVDYQTSGDTATAGSDFTSVAGTETITAGLTEAVITVPILDDLIDETDETLTVTLTSPVNATLSDATATGTILDDDAVPDIAVTSMLTVSEGVGSAAVTVSLSAISGRDVGVDYATSDVTAVAGSDYTAVSGVITVTAGSMTTTISVPIVDDGLDEATESLQVTISNPQNGIITAGTSQINIDDNDLPAALSIVDNAVIESAGSMAFTVTLSTVSSQNVQFNYQTSANTATAGSDFTSVAGTETITAGLTEAVITVPILDDLIDETDETLTVTLTSPVNATLGDATATGTILDDDAVPDIAVTSVLTVSEGVGSAVVTVSLSAISGRDVGVDYATSDVTAVAGSDYTAVSGVITVTAGSMTTTISVPIVDDGLDEVTESLQVTIANPQNGIITAGTSQINITDNDLPPTLAIADNAVVESAGSMAFTVTLSTVSSQNVQVDYQTSGDTATAGSDFTSVAGTETITAGLSEAVITVPILDDLIDETDETLTVTLTSPVNAMLGDATATGTILDDDAVPDIAVTSVLTVSEGVGSAAVTVSLSAISGRDVGVDYATSDVTAVAGSDYTAVSGVITVTAGSMTTTISVPIVDDGLDEVTESLQLTIANPQNGSITAGTSQINITDNDLPPTLTIADNAVVESAGSMAFTVTLSTVSSQNVQVDYQTSGDTATAGSDFTSVAGTETITAGLTEAVITVPILDDLIDETDETLTVTLTSPVNATLSDATATGTILDDDAVPDIAVTSMLTVSEGVGSAAVTVSLSAISGRDVGVDYATSDVTAVAGSDYTAVSGVITVTAGSMTTTISVPIVDDGLDEVTESLQLTIANPQNGSITAGTSQINITDNDLPPTLTIADNAVVESAGSMAFTVTLSAASGQDVQFDYQTGDITASAGSDYTSVSGIETITAGSTTALITVTLIDDALDEIDETFTITVASPINATIADPVAVGTILDDDAVPDISITPALTVSEGIGNASLTVSLSAVSGRDVGVSYATSNGTAVVGNDYTAASGTLTITAGTLNGTIIVPIIDDALDEINEQLQVTLSSPQNGIIISGTSQITILDNDLPPELSIADVSASEAIGSMAFTVTLSAVSGQDIQFDYNTSGGTASSNVDFTATSGTRLVPAGSMEAIISVPIINDIFDEAVETFAVSISSPISATISDGSATGTIVDDDPLPGLTIANRVVNEAIGTAVVTVTLTPASGRILTVDYQTRAGTANASSDYVTDAGTLTFAPGQTTETISLAIVDDSVDEPNEQFFVDLLSSIWSTIDDGEASITILDDDSAVSIASITDPSVTEGGMAEFEVSLNTVSGLDVTVDYNIAGGTAIAGSDFVSSSGVLTITAGTLTQTLQVPTLTDALYEGNETFRVNLSNPTNAGLLDIQAVGTIVDDDPIPTLTVSDAVVSEVSGSAVVTITQSAVSGLDTTVNYSTTQGTAISGADYTAVASDATIPSGSVETTVVISIIDDALDELTEQFALDFTSANNANLLDPQAQITITDDDAPPEISVADVTVLESSGAAIFTTTLSAPSGQAVIVTYSTTDNEAVAGSDYIASSGTFTIPAGVLSVATPISITDDFVDEPSETFFFDLLTAVPATISDGRAVGTIVDNDASSSISISDASVTEGGNLQFEVVLNAVSGIDVAVTYSTTAGTAASGADYVSQSSVLTITAGVTMTTILIPSVEDTLYETSESFVVELSNPINASLFDSTATGTILNDDLPPEMVIDDVVVNESEGQAQFVVSLSTESGLDTAVDLTTSDLTAVSGFDYTAVTSTLLIPAGIISTTFAIPIVDDALNENSEMFAVGISNEMNVAVTDRTGIATIIDNDALPQIRIGNSFVDESSGSAFITVTLSPVSGRFVTGTYQTRDGSAVGGADYSIAAGQFIIPPGTDTAIISVPIIDDLMNESVEFFFTDLITATFAEIADNEALISIIDNDAFPTLAVTTAVTVTEGELAQFPITLSAVSGMDVVVDYATSNGSAISGLDYVAASGTITIPAGTTSATIPVVTIDDGINESTENLTLSLSNVRDATLENASSIGTILDNDGVPTLTVGDVTVVESGGTAQFTIIVSSVSGLPITVDYATMDVTAVNGNDYQATTAQAVIPAGQISTIVEVPIIDDALDEADESFHLQLMNPQNAAIGDGIGVGLIRDDDPFPTLSIADIAVTEGIGNATVTMTLSTESTRDISVDFTTIAESATETVDFTATSGTATVFAGETMAVISIPIIDDTLNESNERFQIAFTNPQLVSLANTLSHVTILDDDASVLISQITNATAVEGDSIVIEARLSAISGVPVSVDYSTANGTALAGSDYVTVTSQLIIPAGQLTETLTINTVDDAVFEDSEFFTVDFSNPVNAGLLDIQAVATIIDNDDLPTISAVDTFVEEDEGIATVELQLSESSAVDTFISFETVTGLLSPLATDGLDFESRSGVAVISAGNLTTTVEIPILDDFIDEDDERFTLSLFDPVGAMFSGGATTLNVAVTIIDNDEFPQLEIMDVTVLVEGDGGITTTVPVSVVLSNPSSVPVTVTVISVDGTAIAGQDYQALPPTEIVFAAGQTEQVLEVIILGDDIDEPTETFYLQMVGSINARISSQADMGTITILDDDGSTAISIGDQSASESSGSLVFTVALATPSGLPITVTYGTASGSAVSGVDFTPQSGQLLFPPGTLTQTVPISLIDDALFERRETFSLILSDPVNAVLSNASALGSIENDDQLPTVRIAESETTEGQSLNVDVELNVASGLPVTLTLQTADGTATAGSDYVALVTNIVLPAGATSLSVPVATIDDLIDEPTETIELSFASVQGANFDPLPTEGNILDNDAPPTLAVGEVYTFTESIGVVTFTVELDQPSGYDLEINYETFGGSAISNLDFLATNQQITIPAGERSAGIPIVIINDAIKETTEQFTIQLSAVDPSLVNFSRDLVRANILDDEGLVTVGFQDKLFIGREEEPTASITVTLSGAAAFDISVDLMTSDGTATDGFDYQESGARLTIPAGQMSITHTIALLDDNVDEIDETVELLLSDPTGAVIDLSRREAAVTIIDDDGAPSINFRAVQNTVSESAPVAVLQVELTPMSDFFVTVNYESFAATALADIDYRSVRGTVTFVPGTTRRNIEIPIIDDDSLEDTEQFTVALSSPTSGLLGGVSETTVNIVDNESLPLIGIADAAIIEGDIDTSLMVFTVTLSHSAPVTVTVESVAIDDSAVAGEDYIPTAMPVTFNPGEVEQFITVPIIGDGDVESDETFKVVLMNATNGVISVGESVGTILNDDEASPSWLPYYIPLILR